MGSTITIMRLCVGTVMILVGCSGSDDIISAAQEDTVAQAADVVVEDDDTAGASTSDSTSSDEEVAAPTTDTLVEDDATADALADDDTPNDEDTGPDMPTPCDSDKDCTNESLVCDALTGACVQCLFDTQCDDVHHCIDHLCAPFTPCVNSLDCVDAAQGPICDPESSECVLCVVAEDCDGVADCVAGACQVYTPCQSSTECDADQVCDAAAERCVQCVGDNDCDEQEHCTDSVCSPFTGCDSDKDCTSLGQLCDKDVGECSECLSHADCPNIYHCDVGSCALDVCIQDQGACDDNVVTVCSEVGDAFDAPTPCGAEQTCVQSELNASCQDWVCTPNATCVDNVATTCSADGLSMLDSTDCEASGEICVAGVCQDLQCSPLSTYCDGTTIMTCNEDGSASSAGQACADTDQACSVDDGVAVCKTPICTAGQSYCDGTEVKTCSNDGLDGTSVEDCASTGKLCVAGVCSDLPPGCDGGVDASLEGVQHRFCPSSMTWTQAAADCQASGMHLVKIVSQTQSDWLVEQANSAIPGWTKLLIGLKHSNNVWKWTDGTSASWTNWGNSQPTDEFLCSLIVTSGKWQATACNGPSPGQGLKTGIGPYVCSWP